MDPASFEPDNRYAPPVSEVLRERAEPWTLAGSIRTAMRTSLRSPLLAWVGLGVIPNLTAVPGMLELDDAETGLPILVLMFVISAVIAGGQSRIAVELVRQRPVSFGAFIACVRLAPSFFALNLPAFIPSVLVYLIGAPDDPDTVAGLLLLAFALAACVGLYLMYRFSLASYALVDTQHGLRQAVGHSWARIGANTGQFVALFVVLSLPFLVSFALSVAVPPASLLFNVATLPIVTLAWAHVYDATRETGPAPRS